MASWAATHGTRHHARFRAAAATSRSRAQLTAGGTIVDSGAHMHSRAAARSGAVARVRRHTAAHSRVAAPAPPQPPPPPVGLCAVAASPHTLTVAWRRPHGTREVAPKPNASAVAATPATGAASGHRAGKHSHAHADTAQSRSDANCIDAYHVQYGRKLFERWIEVGTVPVATAPAASVAAAGGGPAGDDAAPERRAAVGAAQGAGASAAPPPLMWSPPPAPQTPGGAPEATAQSQTGSEPAYVALPRGWHSAIVSDLPAATPWVVRVRAHSVGGGWGKYSVPVDCWTYLEDGSKPPAARALAVVLQSQAAVDPTPADEARFLSYSRDQDAAEETSFGAGAWLGSGARNPRSSPFADFVVDGPPPGFSFGATDGAVGSAFPPPPPPPIDTAAPATRGGANSDFVSAGDTSPHRARGTSAGSGSLSMNCDRCGQSLERPGRCGQRIDVGTAGRPATTTCVCSMFVPASDSEATFDTGDGSSVREADGECADCGHSLEVHKSGKGCVCERCERVVCEPCGSYHLSIATATLPHSASQPLLLAQAAGTPEAGGLADVSSHSTPTSPAAAADATSVTDESSVDARALDADVADGGWERPPPRVGSLVDLAAVSPTALGAATPSPTVATAAAAAAAVAVAAKQPPASPDMHAFPAAPGAAPAGLAAPSERPSTGERKLLHVDTRIASGSTGGSSGPASGGWGDAPPRPLSTSRTTVRVCADCYEAAAPPPVALLTPGMRTVASVSSAGRDSDVWTEVSSPVGSDASFGLTPSATPGPAAPTPQDAGSSFDAGTGTYSAASSAGGDFGAREGSPTHRADSEDPITPLTPDQPTRAGDEVDGVGILSPIARGVQSEFRRSTSLLDFLGTLHRHKHSIVAEPLGFVRDSTGSGDPLRFGGGRGGGGADRGALDSPRHGDDDDDDDDSIPEAATEMTDEEAGNEEDAVTAVTRVADADAELNGPVGDGATAPTSADATEVAAGDTPQAGSSASAVPAHVRARFARPPLQRSASEYLNRGRRGTARPLAIRTVVSDAAAGGDGGDDGDGDGSGEGDGDGGDAGSGTEGETAGPDEAHSRAVSDSAPARKSLLVPLDDDASPASKWRPEPRVPVATATPSAELVNTGRFTFDDTDDADEDADADGSDGVVEGGGDGEAGVDEEEGGSDLARADDTAAAGVDAAHIAPSAAGDAAGSHVTAETEGTADTAARTAPSASSAAASGSHAHGDRGKRRTKKRKSRKHRAAPRRLARSKLRPRSKSAHDIVELLRARLQAADSLKELGYGSQIQLVGLSGGDTGAGVGASAGAAAAAAAYTSAASGAAAAGAGAGAAGAGEADGRGPRGSISGGGAFDFDWLPADKRRSFASSPPPSSSDGGGGTAVAAGSTGGGAAASNGDKHDPGGAEAVQRRKRRRDLRRHSDLHLMPRRGSDAARRDQVTQAMIDVLREPDVTVRVDVDYEVPVFLGTEAREVPVPPRLGAVEPRVAPGGGGGEGDRSDGSDAGEPQFTAPTTAIARTFLMGTEANYQSFEDVVKSALANVARVAMHEDEEKARQEEALERNAREAADGDAGGAPEAASGDGGGDGCGDPDGGDAGSAGERGGSDAGADSDPGAAFRTALSVMSPVALYPSVDEMMRSVLVACSRTESSGDAHLRVHEIFGGEAAHRAGIMLRHLQPNLWSQAGLDRALLPPSLQVVLGAGGDPRSVIVETTDLYEVKRTADLEGDCWTYLQTSVVQRWRLEAMASPLDVGRNPAFVAAFEMAAADCDDPAEALQRQQAIAASAAELVVPRFVDKGRDLAIGTVGKRPGRLSVQVLGLSDLIVPEPPVPRGLRKKTRRGRASTIGVAAVGPDGARMREMLYVVAGVGGTHAQGQDHALLPDLSATLAASKHGGDGRRDLTVAEQVWGSGRPCSLRETQWHESFEMPWDGKDVLVVSVWRRRVETKPATSPKHRSHSGGAGGGAPGGGATAVSALSAELSLAVAGGVGGGGGGSVTRDGTPRSPPDGVGDGGVDFGAAGGAARRTASASASTAASGSKPARRKRSLTNMASDVLRSATSGVGAGRGAGGGDAGDGAPIAASERDELTRAAATAANRTAAEIATTVVDDVCLGTGPVSLLGLAAGAPVRAVVPLRRASALGSAGGSATPPGGHGSGHGGDRVLGGLPGTGGDDDGLLTTGYVHVELCYWTHAPAVYVPPPAGSGARAPLPRPGSEDYMHITPRLAGEREEVRMLESLEVLF